MIRKNKILALLLAVFLILPVFGTNIAHASPISAISTSTDFDVGNSVFIDYFAERIWVLPGLAMWENNIITTADRSNQIASLAKTAASHQPNGKPLFMYSFRAASDAQLNNFVHRNRMDRYVNTLAKEKWYPIYGGGIDIEKAIPNRGGARGAGGTGQGREYVIAIRKADDVFNNIDGFESRVGFTISPRYNNRLTRDLEYDAVNERIVLAPFHLLPPDNSGVIYQFENFQPRDAQITSESGINVKADLFPLGTTLNISTAPMVSADMNTVTFARSRTVKFKIPRQPAPPALRFDEAARRISGMKGRGVFEFTFDDPASATATWTLYENTSTTITFTTFDQLAAAFTGLTQEACQTAIITDGGEETDGYEIFVRVKAVEKKTPASPAVRIIIPARLFENQNKSE